MPEIPEISATISKKASFTRPLLFVLVLAGLCIVARSFDLQDYLHEDRLQRLIGAYGMWGPLVYLLAWAIVPILFLPCLPLTLVGGVLFGPVWGVVYAVIGATTGASLAFLVARYLARDWVAEKISRSRLKHLDEKVGQHGWKIVAFTRLIPVLPFFVLNYAFGLTRIPFMPYALATFFAMLPWTIAFVLVASNLLGLLRGQVSIWFVIGGVLVAVVSLLPVIFRKVKARRGEPLDI